MIGYWISTTLVALAFFSGGIVDLMRSPEMLAGMTQLGYPPYFLLILGAWKVLAAPALLAPGLPRLKEWAYAGIIFDLTGAAASHGFVGDEVGKIIAPLVLMGIALASWALRPAGRTLKVVA